MAGEESLEPLIRFEFIPWADRMPGEDEADHVRQMVVRATFLDEVLHDERTAAFFGPWCRELDESLTAAAAALRVYAAACGRTPVELVVSLDAGAQLRNPQEIGVEGAAGAFAEGARTITELSDEAAHVAERMAEPLTRFVLEELRIEYPWVVASLLRGFFVDLMATMIAPGTPYVSGWVLASAGDRASADATLRVQRGESRDEVEHRVSALMASLFPVGSAEQPRAKPFPKGGGESLAMDTRMFYRAEIQGLPRAAVAREFDVTRQRVQQAIKRVGSLLEIYMPWPQSKEHPRKVQRRSPRR